VRPERIGCRLTESKEVPRIAAEEAKGKGENPVDDLNEQASGVAEKAKDVIGKLAGEADAETSPEFD